MILFGILESAMNCKNLSIVYHKHAFIEQENKKVGVFSLVG